LEISKNILHYVTIPDLSIKHKPFQIENKNVNINAKHCTGQQFYLLNKHVKFNVGYHAILKDNYKTVSYSVNEIYINTHKEWPKRPKHVCEKMNNCGKY
jgi:hypothetical protein